MKQLLLLSGLLLLAACDGPSATVPTPTDTTPAPTSSEPGAYDPALDLICDSQTPTAACDSEEYRNARAAREAACEDARREAGLTGYPVRDPNCQQ